MFVIAAQSNSNTEVEEIWHGQKSEVGRRHSWQWAYE